MKQKHSLTAKMGPSIGSSIRDWMRLTLSNGSVALKYYPRVFLIDLLSTFGIPFRVYERWRFDKIVEQIELKKPPIFILGHWRSGTTHLHNLMVQDPQFGYVTMFQAAFPKSFLANKFFENFMKIFLPDKRPMDNMRLGLDFAQEEEMALGNLFPYSFYNGFYFPRKLKEFYYKYIRFENVPSRIRQKWNKVYNSLLRKATLNMHGKRLILKNPANTARIKFLLELYPEAQFIHIYRNPYIVYMSTKYFYEKMIRAFTFQNISDEDLENQILWIYKRMMESYFEEKKLIPKGNLIEIKFENLESDPLYELESIYNGLNISGFKNSEQAFLNYLKPLKSYKKNVFEFSQRIIDKVNVYWNFTIEKWKYDIPKLPISKST